jgi:hypothetical protein
MLTRAEAALPATWSGVAGGGFIAQQRTGREDEQGLHFRVLEHTLSFSHRSVGSRGSALGSV